MLENEIVLENEKIPTKQGYTPIFIRNVNYYEGDYHNTEEYAINDTIIINIPVNGENEIYENDLIQMWQEDLSKVDGGYFLIELTAYWTANTYTIVYDANLPEIASGSVSGVVENTNCTYDGERNLRNLTDANRYSLLGWSLLGWSETADGSGVNYLFNYDPSDENPLHKSCNNVPDLATEQGETVTLYAIWQQNSYQVVLQDEEGINNNFDSFTVLFDSTMVIEENLFVLGEYVGTVEENYFDETNQIYYEFGGWEYYHDGPAGRIYDNDAEISVALYSNGGFISEANLNQANVQFVFKVRWVEVEYDLVLDLNGGSYESSNANFNSRYEMSTGHNTLTTKIKYSQIKEDGVGFDLTTLGFNVAYLRYQNNIEFAGWSLSSDNSVLNFDKNSNIVINGISRNELENNHEFRIYADWCTIKIFVSGNGGHVKSSLIATTSPILDAGYNWEDSQTIGGETYYNSVYKYTYKGAIVTLPGAIDNWFERENYHIGTGIGGAQIQVSSSNHVENIDWMGNSRKIILDLSEYPTAAFSVDANFSKNSNMVNGGFKFADVNSENFALNTYYIYSNFTFVEADSYDEGETYYEEISNAKTIGAIYGESIEDIYLITATFTDKTFRGWIDSTGRENYSLKPLLVNCNDVRAPR